MATANKFGPLQWAIVLLTVFTAGIHLWIGLIEISDPIFVLNGVGYLVLLGLLYLPIAFLVPYRNIARWVLIAYTAVTLFAWVFLGVRDVRAYIDKASEIALIICLWLEWQRGRQTAQPA